MTGQPVVMEIPGTDYAVVVATWDQATTPLPADKQHLPGLGEAVAYTTALDEAVFELRRQGYVKCKQTVWSPSRDVVTLARRNGEA